MMLSPSAFFSYVLGLLLCSATGVRLFHAGRPSGGFLSPPPTSIPPQDLPKEQYFTQKLDHFDAVNTSTWQQRYFTNDSFWNKGVGPIFLMIGGEGPASPAWNVEGSWILYAQENRALTIQLEHRYILCPPYFLLAIVVRLLIQFHGRVLHCMCMHPHEKCLLALT